MSTTNLNKALLAAQQVIISVAKDATNQFHKYEYVTSESMVAECRAALHSNGLLLTLGDATYSDSLKHSVVFQASSGETPAMIEVATVVVNRRFTLIHAESGESKEYSFSFPAVPERGRPIDKAVAGALTTSLSYFLRDLLLVPRGDENTMDRRPEQETHAQRQVPAAPVKVPKAPTKAAAPEKKTEQPAAAKPAQAEKAPEKQAEKKPDQPAKTPKQQALAATQQWLNTNSAEKVTRALIKIRGILFPNFKDGDVLDDACWHNVIEYINTTKIEEFNRAV